MSLLKDKLYYESDILSWKLSILKNNNQQLFVIKVVCTFLIFCLQCLIIFSKSLRAVIDYAICHLKVKVMLKIQSMNTTDYALHPLQPCHDSQIMKPKDELCLY